MRNHGERTEPRELREYETPVIQYSLKARLETHFEEDLERIDLTLDEYETLKRTLAESRKVAQK